MKIHFEPQKKSPFIVSPGFYVGRFINYREPKKAVCSCPISDQVALDFELTDPFSDSEEEYRAQVIVCKNPTCQHKAHGISAFLAKWLEDRIDELTDEKGDVDLEQLLRLRGDVEIVAALHDPRYPHPYSQVRRVVPLGRLIDRSRD